jgi:hypothetical protein
MPAAGVVPALGTPSRLWRAGFTATRRGRTGRGPEGAGGKFQASSG